jgi:predicted nucleic acid-binding protein
VLIDHLAAVPEASALLSKLAQDGIAISIVTYMEAFQGVGRSPQPEQAHGKFQAFAESVLILPVSFAVAEQSQNKRVHSRTLDLIIAATALEHDLPLVTRNTEDYQDVAADR